MEKEQDHDPLVRKTTNMSLADAGMGVVNFKFVPSEERRSSKVNREMKFRESVTDANTKKLEEQVLLVRSALKLACFRKIKEHLKIT